MLDKVFFEDIPQKAKQEAKTFREEVSRLPALEIPFFKQLSTAPTSLDLSKKQTTPIQLLVPEQAIDTRDPKKNTKEFYTQNIIVALENEYMMTQVLRQLSEIENMLLYLLVEKKQTLTQDLINQYVDYVKKRLVVFRHPLNRDLYNNYPKFNMEFDITLKYIKENRLWKGEE